jgi:hypothetical protein
MSRLKVFTPCNSLRKRLQQVITSIRILAFVDLVAGPRHQLGNKCVEEHAQHILAPAHVPHTQTASTVTHVFLNLFSAG